MKKIFEKIKKIIIIISVTFTFVFLVLLFTEDDESSFSNDNYSYSEQESNDNPWRKLEKGMSKKKVKRILGEPLRVKVSNYWEDWYYGEYSFETYVRFNNSGGLQSWTE